METMRAHSKVCVYLKRGIFEKVPSKTFAQFVLIQKKKKKMDFIRNYKIKE